MPCEYELEDNCTLENPEKCEFAKPSSKLKIIYHCTATEKDLILEP